MRRVLNQPKIRWRLSWASLVLLAGMATCGGIDTFTLTEEAQTTIEGSLLGQLVGDLGFAGFVQMDVSQNQELENRGVKKNQIDSVKVRTITLTIPADSDGQDLSFIDDIAFYVESEGLERRLLATGADFDAGATEVGLDVEDVELAPYVAAESMDITTEATGSPPADDTTIDAAVLLDVDVNITGAICGG